MGDPTEAPPLVEEEPRRSQRGDNAVLPECWRKLGVALESAGSQADAIGALSTSVDLLRRNQGHSSSVQFADGLANAFKSLGIGLKNASRYEEALQAYAEGLKIRETLPPGCNRQDWLSAAAWLHSNRARVFEDMKDYPSAIKAQRAAIEIHRRLFRESKTRERTEHLCDSIANLSLTHQKVGRYSESLTLTAEAIELRKTMPEGCNRAEWLANIAWLHLDRSETFRKDGRFEEAIQEVRRAEPLIRRIDAPASRKLVTGVLAMCCKEKAAALKGFERHEESRLAQEEEAMHRRLLFRMEATPERARDLAEALDRLSECWVLAQQDTLASTAKQEANDLRSRIPAAFAPSTKIPND